ncbi:conserved hypothetical protein [Vibrio nigripulchritudo SOn1]|uniref:Type II citrate synthase n=1 Tax=Vibrio nigripulchritudo SOn1 TaxID=1238450 RepID=A0AAV2VX55_9VIBR|nr:DUF1853 family protein [Vibrio nigripulchritudo]CCO49334.1 conserved hypothetical protein [Vibrio nigripulchritudo SOn1]
MLSKQELNKLLKWVIQTPALFKQADPIVEIPPFSASITKSIEEYEGNARLGFVYQYLCQKLFENNPQYLVKDEEIQLNQNGKTLGAIDFIIQNQLKDEIEHWEVAIKFYLFHNGLWFGPNAKDRLDIKLEHMLTHQLKMSSSEAFKCQFPQWQHLQERLLMQGRLYINPFLDNEVPTHCCEKEINKERVKGYWCYENQKHRIEEPLYVLEKKNWITGRTSTSSLLEEETNIGKFIHCQSESGQYWFIVNQGWPN